MPQRSSLLPAKNRHSSLWIGVALFAVTVGVYWPSLANGFVNLDDPPYVGHPFVEQGLTWPSVRWALTTLEMSNWHPLMWMSLEFDHQLFGRNPAGYHAVSLLIHAVNSVLLFKVFAQMTGAVARSGCLAALFALHPLHVESVAWVAERKDLLSGFFWLATVWTYDRYRRRPSWLKYAAVLLTFTLGLMAKPMLVTLPLVLLLLDYWPMGRGPARRTDLTPSAAAAKPGEPKSCEARSTTGWLVAEKIPLIVLSIASCAVTVAAQTRGGALRTNDEHGLAVRLASVPLNYLAYVGRTIWPANLAAMYPYSRELPPLWQWLAATALLAAISLLAIRFASRLPYAAVGWFWFLCTLVPVIGILQVGRQATADRYMYMPIVGLLILLCWGVGDLAARQRWSATIVTAATALLLTGCAAATWLQVSYWHDSVRLWRHALAVVPRSAPARKLLASALVEQAERDGDSSLLEEAEELFRESIRLEPNDEPARVQLARLLWQSGRLEEAAQQLEVVLETNRNSPLAYRDMGYLAEQRGKLDAAIGYYREAVRLDPNYGAAHERLGRALIEQGDVVEGEQHLAEAARLSKGEEATPSPSARGPG
jgi:tetratricopeptide (TPR) repeat protein